MLSTFKNMAAGYPWSSTLTGTRENLLEMLTDPGPTVIKAISLALARLSFLSVTRILQVGVTVECVGRGHTADGKPAFQSAQTLAQKQSLLYTQSTASQNNPIPGEGCETRFRDQGK